mgnify:CR=1 FL=1
MTKIFLILLLVFSDLCLVAEAPVQSVPFKELSVPYPFSQLVSSIITLSHNAQQEAHIGIVLPDSYRKQFAAMIQSAEVSTAPVILFFTQSADHTTVAFVHASYPQLDFLILITFSETKGIITNNNTLTRGEFFLIQFFNQSGEKTQFELINSFFYPKTQDASQEALEIIPISLQHDYSSNPDFWNSFFTICAKPSFTSDEIYVLPLLFWIVPVKPELLYIIVLFLFLINLIVFRNAIHNGKNSAITMLMLSLIFIVLWFSLVFTFYFLSLLLLKQLLVKSSLQKALFVYPLLFWVVVFVHDNIFYTVQKTTIAHTILVGIVFVSSLILSIVPTSTDK